MFGQVDSLTPEERRMIEQENRARSEFLRTIKPQRSWCGIVIIMVVAVSAAIVGTGWYWWA